VPLETRKLEFTEAELQSALVSYALRRERELPESNVDDVIIGAGNNPTVTLNYVPDEPGGESAVEFAGSEVAAALILYCRDHEIPLPRDARKVLVEEDGGLSMIVRVEWEE
jgi:hypothetical protein